ncbi:MAG: nicotinamide riboside transporter PnuC [Bacteroidia bacterium]
MPSFLEIISVIFNITSVLFARKASIWAYPTGLLGVSIQAYLCFANWGLFADGSINIYFAIMSIWGWWMWGKPENELSIHPWNASEKRVAWSLFFIFLFIFYVVLVRYTSSTVPLADALVSAASVSAMYLMAKKATEQWVWWIAIDLLSVPLYSYKNAPFVAAQFLIFTFLAYSGWKKWKVQQTTLLSK